MKIKNILIVGAGVMGQQVGLYHAMYGYNITMFDINADALERCKKNQRDYIQSFAQSRPEGFTINDLEAGLARISYSTDLATAAKDIDLVNESAPELLAVKQQVYAELNRHCPEHTIFTTNTSTLLPSTFAESTGRPERFLALHYGNRVWDTSLAEVMKHAGTDEAIFERVLTFAKENALIPIRIEKEQPAYVINSMVVPWVMAGLSLVANGIASYQDVDRTWKMCTYMGAGPLGSLDHMGFEVLRNVLKNMIAAEPENKQHQINLDFIQTNYIDKGHMGVSTGQGFYSYPNPEYAEPSFITGE